MKREQTIGVDYEGNLNGVRDDFFDEMSTHAAHNKMTIFFYF